MLNKTNIFQSAGVGDGGGGCVCVWGGWDWVVDFKVAKRNILLNLIFLCAATGCIHN